MERCPNCGQMNRMGAKFCTICGNRIAEGDAAVDLNAMADPAESPSSGDASPDPESESSWPAVSAAIDPPATSGWETPSADDPAELPEAPLDEDEIAPGAAAWPSAAAGTWPAPQTDDEPAFAPAEAPDVEPPAAVAEEVAVIVPDSEESADQAHDPRERAGRLLDELRDVIAALGGEQAIDLTGVISELEVAVTPPGAIDPEELATLREALLAARQRPRDLDTVVDLTGRIDAMVALVFAYDRTIAAIERSLDVLRRE